MVKISVREGRYVRKMKQKYENPVWEIITFDESDIVLASCGIDTTCLNIDTPPACLRMDGM